MWGKGTVAPDGGRRWRRAWALTLVLALAAVSVAAWGLAAPAAAGGPDDDDAEGDEPKGLPPLRPEAIIIRPDPADLRTSIWTDRARYRPGDRVRISFYVSHPAYVYIYDLDTTGKVRLIFPNRYEMDNFLPAGTHTIPRRAYSFVVSGPPGAEYLQIIATVRPLNELAPPSAFLQSPFPDLGDSAPEVKGRVERMLRPVGKGWATAWTGFWVVGPTPPPPPPPPPPVPPPSLSPPPPPPPPWRYEWGTLRIDSHPSGARAYVDGDYVGRTPTEVRVRVGWHTVRLRLEDYPERELRVYVEPGEYERVEVYWPPEEQRPEPPPDGVDRRRGRPAPSPRPSEPVGARVGFSLGVDAAGIWSLGLEGGRDRWLLGGSARFTGPFLPSDTRHAEPQPWTPEIVPNGPEWEVYLKFAPGLTRKTSLEASLGLAWQPRGAVEQGFSGASADGTPRTAALVPKPNWYPVQAEFHVTWSVGARFDLGTPYVAVSWHNRRGLVGGLGLRF